MRLLDVVMQTDQIPGAREICVVGGRGARCVGREVCVDEGGSCCGWLRGGSEGVFGEESGVMGEMGEE